MVYKSEINYKLIKAGHEIKWKTIANQVFVHVWERKKCDDMWRLSVQLDDGESFFQQFKIMFYQISCVFWFLSFMCVCVLLTYATIFALISSSLVFTNLNSSNAIHSFFFLDWFFFSISLVPKFLLSSSFFFCFTHTHTLSVCLSFHDFSFRSA